MPGAVERVSGGVAPLGWGLFLAPERAQGGPHFLIPRFLNGESRLYTTTSTSTIFMGTRRRFNGPSAAGALKVQNYETLAQEPALQTP